MSFTIPILVLLNRSTPEKAQSWKDIKFWLTKDGRVYSMNEMSAQHLINIARQIVNRACIEANIDPIPIPYQRAKINLDTAPAYAWVSFCKLILEEIDLRQPGLTRGYPEILEQIRVKVAILSKRYLPDGKSKDQE